MSLLIYSPKCGHCKDIIEFIQKNPALKSLVSYHNIHTQPIPQHYRNQINRVPTLLTKNQKFLVGQEIKAWLRSLLPPDEIANCSLRGTCGVSIDGEDDGVGDLFSLDDYGTSLAAPMTPEIEAKIKKQVQAAQYQT
jgi:thiol-disulfide isomerase/thioredoxin